MEGLEALLGGKLATFLGLTLFFAGGCAFMAGQALARTWRPEWQILPYMLLLAAADRFLDFALFGGRLLSLTGFLVDGVALIAIAFFAYRLTRAHQMVTQYPWLYERVGLFGWKNKP